MNIINVSYSLGLWQPHNKSSHGCVSRSIEHIICPVHFPFQKVERQTLCQEWALDIREERREGVGDQWSQWRDNDISSIIRHRCVLIQGKT